MLNRLTVSALLQAVILTTAFFIVLGFSLTAWDSWERLQLTNRMAVVADASANMFKAMDRLRSDRSTTNRLLNSDQPLDGEMDKYLRGLRDVEMPAMSHALEVLPSIAFAQQQILVPEFDRLLKTVVAEQKEFWEEIAKPKASRRAALGKEYMDTETALLATLDKISGVLAAEINHQDATIDQLLMIKQTAWLLRNTAGETSLLVSNGLAAGKLTPENQQAYTKLAGGIEIAWKALETATGGMKLPAALSAAIDANKSAYFDPQYLALRDRLLTALVAGEKPELTANQWSPLTVARLSAAVGVADAALAAAQDPIEAHVGEFEGMVRQTLQQLGDASSQMRTTSSGLSTVSRQTNKRVEVAEKASNEASMSVESVASASEELSASINDISQQAAHAAGIASRAVSQASETDGTVQGLAKSAGRIGEVVGLINTIAAQTNLLALNATIEAARAGEAGRGFAVVASEVKSLASQTAKATDEISEQISEIQKVDGEAIDAIKGIGGIIGEVNEVATAIAAAVHQQGAATQEITRSTQFAAQGTKNVSENITGVKADADAAAAAAENVKEASQTLETQSQQLRNQVTH